MRFLPIFFLFFSIIGYSQSNYPQDYFGSPLEVPLIPSGTFAELRSNHFHSGLDIKTQQRVGLKVLASASGYVSRIKVSHYGYGKALYITHPNGYTTVYAHLQKFSPEIEAYVKKQQYAKESYEIELFPKVGLLNVTKGLLIAYSGNSGGSGGPHLHFEIRDKQERPINPMLFGIEIKDSSFPIVKSVYAYTLSGNSFVNKSQGKLKLRLTPLQNGDYITQSIDAIGDIGFGINTFDRQDHAANSNGVYNIQTFVNGSQTFELDFKRFSFDETKHLNELIDYGHYIKKRERIQKLFKKNNPLSIIKPIINNGVVNIQDSTQLVYKIRVTDFKNNEAWVTIPIKGTKSSIAHAEKPKITPYHIKANQAVNLKQANVSVDFYKNTFYDDFYMDFDVKNDTLKLHDDVIACQKNFNISFDVSKYAEKDIEKLYVARLVGYNQYPSYTYTTRKGNQLIARTKKLGTYTLAIDTIKPSISASNFKNGQWMSKYRYLKIKIEDEGSGISNYRATVNGKWILMEYDYKTKTLTHNFSDGIVTDTKNNLKVIVTDNVGNNSTFETLFYRK